MNQMVKRVRIGLFVAGSLVALVLVILLLGKSQVLFKRHATLYTQFNNASGLVIGAPVRLAGIDIGIVGDIYFAKDSEAKKVVVVMRVDSSYLTRIREDSLAQMNSKGLLGDMIINITLGGSNAAPLGDGDLVRSKELEGLPQVIASVESVVTTVRKLTEVVDERFRAIVTEDLAKDIGRITHSTANIIEQVEHGQGLAHRVLFDPELSASAAGVLAEARQSARHVARSTERVDKILAQVETGDGLIHGLVYDPQGKQAVAELRNVSKDLHDILAEVQHGNGVVHSLIYEKDETNLIENLTLASQTVRKMVQEVDQGKGTVGGLLKDPTLYRDLKSIFGQVERNALLKALIRMTIKKDNLERIERPEEPEETASGERAVGAQGERAASPPR